MQFPQAKNAEADFFTRLASSDDYNATSKLCIEIRGQPSIEGEQVLKVKEQDGWITPIIRYLKKDGSLKIRRKQGRYRSRQPASSSLTTCCTDEDIHSPI